jgi:hypothetical protein
LPSRFVSIHAERNPEELTLTAAFLAAAHLDHFSVGTITSPNLSCRRATMRALSKRSAT